MDLMLRIGRWSKSWDDTVDKPGYKWFIHNGMSFDWRGYRTESCPSSHKECANTYTLCGECVHDHWIGNFIYAYTLKLADFSRWTIHKAGQAVQGPGPGDPPQSNWIHYVDPPWDKAGYDLAIAILEADSSPITGDALCKSLKSNDDLWKKANDTSPTYQSRPRFHGGHVDRYPSPHAKGYDICKPCTETVTEPLRGLPGME
jgi:hypothetical protein